MTYFEDAITPAIREVMVEMSGARWGCLGIEEAMRMAWVLRRVAIGWRPAARIVSPDSESCVHEARGVCVRWHCLLTDEVN